MDYSNEIRSLEKQLELLKNAANIMKDQAAMREAVLKVLSDVDPELRAKVLAKLKELQK